MPPPGSYLPNLNIQIRSPLSNAEWENYYQLRWEILRNPWNQPRGSECDQYDKQAYHILAQMNQETIGVGRLHTCDNVTGQIRYMAVCTKHQGQGIGTQILTALENHASDKNLQRIILNARDSALEFYKRSNYQVVAPGHTLYNEVTHTKMEKWL